MPSESGATQFATKPKASSDVLARILAKGKDPTPYRRLAGELLDQFGSLDALARAGTQPLLTIPSLNAEDVSILEALGDLVGMLGSDDHDSRSPVIDSFTALGRYLRAQVHRPSVGAQLRLILLDQGHRIVGDVELQPGRGPSLTARAVVVAVLEHRAAGIMLARVQAGTRIEMSEEFAETVRQVRDALWRLDVPLLDVALATPTEISRVSELSASRIAQRSSAADDSHDRPVDLDGGMTRDVR